MYADINIDDHAVFPSFLNDAKYRSRAPPVAPHSFHSFSQFQIPDVTASGNGDPS